MEILDDHLSDDHSKWNRVVSSYTVMLQIALNFTLGSLPNNTYLTYYFPITSFNPIAKHGYPDMWKYIKSFDQEK